MELRPGGPRLALDIVPRGERVSAQVPCCVQKIAGLDPLVAAHAGARRLAAQIAVGEVVYLRLGETAFIDPEVMRKVQRVGNPPRVVDVLAGAAGENGRA